MTGPALHVIAGPNGAGKTTFYEHVLGPATHLDFINADFIAAHLWPKDAATHSYEAAQLAAAERQRRIDARTSFATETVFSHASKLQLLRDARAAGFRTTLHIVLIPEELAVARVVNRVSNGGHHVPEQKVRERFGRLWSLLAEAITLVDDARVYENTVAHAPFKLVAVFNRGLLVGEPVWPTWTPPELVGPT